MPTLSVDPSALDGAGSALIDVGKDIGLTMSSLEGVLSGCGSMCGNDPVGAAMGQRYDSTAAAVGQAMAAARNGLVNLGDGVRVSAHNYSLADALSDVSGRTQPLPVPPASGKITASTTPSSVGAGDAAPAGFGWVAKYIGMIWPNGDSAQLRAAAAAWTAAGAHLLVTETSAAGPLGIVGGQHIPEVEAMGQAFAASVNGAVQIMAQCTTIASQLNAYAAKIDAVHVAIIDLLSRICDPMTGFKEVWDVLTGEDEDEIRQIADDIKTVVDNFKTEASALAAEMAPAMAAAENIASAMGQYADKEWNQFLHGTDVGRMVDQDLRVAKGFLGQAGGLLKDNWKYGPLRAMTQTDRWLEDWKNTISGMAPLVGLGGDGSPGVGESWKDVGKGLLHWDEWSKDPADALGRSLFDIATFFVPGGELGAAGKVTHEAADAAEAAAKAAPHAAEVAPQALRDVTKGAESVLPPTAPVHPLEAPTGGAPRALPDAPAKPPAGPDAAPPPRAAVPTAAAEPKSAPASSPVPHGPTERAPSGAGAAEHGTSLEGPKPTVEPATPSPSAHAPAAGSSSLASLPESSPSSVSATQGAADGAPTAASGGHLPSAPMDSAGASHPGAMPHDGGAGSGGPPHNAGSGVHDGGGGHDGVPPHGGGTAGDHQPHNPPHTGLYDPPANHGVPGDHLPDLAEINKEFRLPDGSVDPSRISEWAQRISDAYPALSKEQIEAIYKYTTENYQSINPYLRNIDDLTLFQQRMLGSESIEAMTHEQRLAMELQISRTDDGLAALPPYRGDPSDLTSTTWRGLRAPESLLDQLKEGDIFQDPGYLSSSVNQQVAESFARGAGDGETPTILTVVGEDGVDVAPLSRWSDESEILFPRGASFEVVSRVPGPDGILRIVMRQVK